MNYVYECSATWYAVVVPCIQLRSHTQTSRRRPPHVRLSARRVRVCVRFCVTSCPCCPLAAMHIPNTMQLSQRSQLTQPPSVCVCARSTACAMARHSPVAVATHSHNANYTHTSSNVLAHWRRTARKRARVSTERSAAFESPRRGATGSGSGATACVFSGFCVVVGA